MSLPILPSRLRAGLLLLFATTLPLLAGCDDESLVGRDTQGSSELFDSYVALGNSITAGFQSGGINKNLQQDSYAVQLAEQMGTPFNIPSLTVPGCPPPLAQALPPERISDVSCALRESVPPGPVHNVAVPNATVLDALSNLDPASNPNPLTQFILGGQTQVEAAKQANPTFASVWIGNNDVLGAALNGDTTLATSPNAFQDRYETLVSELESIETLEGAVFVGVANAILIPHFSRGAAYQQVKDAGGLPENLEFEACAPSEAGLVRVPFRHGAVLIQAAAGLAEQFDDPPSIEIDCAQDRTVEETIRDNLGPAFEIPVLDQIPDNVKPISLLTPEEASVLQERVATFNEIIQSRVSDEFAYVNPNPLFEENSDQIPAFPALSSDAPFGPLFSLDGIHPNATTHNLVANELIQAINATYDTDLASVQ